MTSPTNTTSTVLQKLYEWWAAPNTADETKSFLDAALEYDLGYGGLDGQGWIWLVQQAPLWRELRVIDRVVHEHKGALVFEGVDGATELRHRISWLVEVRDGKVVRVLETNALIA